jgi:hypothetical protein
MFFLVVTLFLDFLPQDNHPSRYQKDVFFSSSLLLSGGFAFSSIHLATGLNVSYLFLFFPLLFAAGHSTEAVVFPALLRSLLPGFSSSFPLLRGTRRRLLCPVKLAEFIDRDSRGRVFAALNISSSLLCTEYTTSILLILCSLRAV